jgi:hypothetical protein
VRNAVILLFLLFCSVSLPAGSPAAAGSVATGVHDGEGAAAYVRPLADEQVFLRHERGWLIAGFVFDATARGLDAYSTCRALRHKKNQEMFLPAEIAKSEPALYGFGASIVVTEYLGYRFLNTHHHERVARWLPFADAALVLPFAVHNLTLPYRGASNGIKGPVIHIQIR